ncbi:hypothetical protein [Selenomonas sp. KH1T6]|uniref:hypothetical protein n=1 Tax=Selenomonas sp. KH1T6 TaxID=3158784 RepID=UPI0008A7BB8D|nr:hypothetical protein SAMN05216583_103183 [Selenomonas ruminantium]
MSNLNYNSNDNHEQQGDNEREGHAIAGENFDETISSRALIPSPNGVTFKKGGLSKRSFNAPEGSVTKIGFPKKRLPKPTAPIRFYTSYEYAAMGQKMIQFELLQPNLPNNHTLQIVDVGNSYAGIEEGSVFERGHALWLKVKGAEAKRITNFIINVMCKKVKLGLHGERMEFYELLLESETQSIRYAIKCNEFLSLQSKIEKDIRSFYVDTAECQKASLYFKRHLSQLIESEEGRLEVRTVLLYPGWCQDENGQWHYYSGLDDNCDSKRMLANLTLLPMEKQYEADRFALSVLGWGESNLMVPVFLHALSGILYRPFKEAGCPVQYILNLCGPTGVGKTLLLRLLFCPFDQHRRMANFTSTAKGIELFCEQCHDSLAALDDLASMKDKKSKVLLETLLRQVCDANGRFFSAEGGKELVVADVSFGLAISTETPLDGFRQSSQLRVLTVEITKDSLHDLSDVKSVILTTITETRELNVNGNNSRSNMWDIFLTRFIRYVESKWNEIVRFIASYEPLQISSGVQFRRLSEVYRVLTAIALIVLRYFADMGVISVRQSEEMFSSWVSTIQEVIRANESRGVESDPAQIFIEVVSRGVAQKLFPIASDKKEYESASSQYLGFWNYNGNDWLVLDPYRIYSWVVKQLGEAGIRMTANNKELWRKLRENGISEGYLEKGRKSPRSLYPMSINKKKIDMLALKACIIRG